jgi:hypothetical protein
MSQENVEIGYRVVAAWNARDINSPASVEPGTRWGHEGLAEVYRAQWDILSDGRWEVDRVHDRHEEVVGLGRISRRMPGSNARIEERSSRFADPPLRNQRAPAATGALACAQGDSNSGEVYDGRCRRVPDLAP